MGPRLLHDHQMVIDSQSQMLYIFGGRIVDRNPEMDVMRFSGFFEYDITANRWTEHLLYVQLFLSGDRLISCNMLDPISELKAEPYQVDSVRYLNFS